MRLIYESRIDNLKVKGHLFIVERPLLGAAAGDGPAKVPRLRFQAFDWHACTVSIGRRKRKRAKVRRDVGGEGGKYFWISLTRCMSTNGRRQSPRPSMG